AVSSAAPAKFNTLESCVMTIDALTKAQSHRVEVGMKPGLPDPAGMAVKHQLAEDLGIEVGDVRVVHVYTIAMDLTPDEVDRVRQELFTDPVIQVSSADRFLARDFDFLVEVGFRPGVTDNVGRSSAEGIADVLGRELRPGETVYKSTQYLFRGGVTREICEHIARDLLANDLIQRWTV